MAVEAGGGGGDPTILQAGGAPTPTNVSTYTPPVNPVQPGASATYGNPSSQWYNGLFEHYVGRDANPAEVNQIKAQQWNYDRLYQHLRSQPSYVKGVSIGALEDYHKLAAPSWFKYLGTEPTDQDIQELINHGVKSGDDIEKYISNRADVVSAHPGAPLGLTDQAWGQHKAAIDSQFQANLGKSATDQEAREAYSQAASPFRKAPAEQFGLGAGVSAKPQVTGGDSLITQSQIATNARSYA